MNKVDTFDSAEQITPRHGFVEALGFQEEIAQLESDIGAWIESCSPEIKPMLRWQFLHGAKYFRPVTLFACYRAVHRKPISKEIRVLAMIVEIVHNMTLVVDDILDRSRFRRQRLSLHCRFGNLRALMTSGYLVAECYRLADDDRFASGLITELMKRLGAAECMQWRLRQQPLGLEDWRRIASEDTGSMFEICACLGGRGEKLRRYGSLLGVLYHGCDDVADVRGVAALGGGGDEDIRDGILTLPASLAIRDPDVAEKFCQPSEQDYPVLARAFAAKLPEAERCLDDIAEEARREAQARTREPQGLIELVEQTRTLSNS